MSGRLTTGAHHQPSAYGADLTRADSNSLAGGLALERSEVSQAVIDCLFVIVVFALVIGLPATGFYLLFF